MLALPATTRTLLLASLYPFRSLALHDYTPQVTLAAYATMASADSDAQTRESSSGGKPMLARHRQNDEAADIKTQTAARNSYFPLSYKDGVAQWWAGLSPAVTEHRVLSFIPYLRQPPTQTQTGGKQNGSSMSVDKSDTKEAAPVKTDSEDPYGPRTWHSNLVQLSGKNRFLNEFSVERLNEKTENSLVMLHGYGAGLGFYYKNFESLSRLPHWKLYALDMPGMGRSSRPPFTIKSKDREGKVREAESWFVDALEEWRVKRGIEKMTLMGHSLGGYMAVCYALKYPGRLEKLILASPVGIPEDPYAVSEAMPTEAEANNIAKEFADAETENLPSHQQSQKSSAAQTPPRRPYSKWLTTLWDANISPFSVVRFAGPLGPRLVSGWTSRRFAHLPAEEAQALHDYSYSLFRQKGSGEYALAYILAPGAFARSPLIRRIQGVGRQYLAPHSEPSPDGAAASKEASAGDVKKVRETGIPVVFYYGDHDWMDVKGGRDAIERMGEEKRKALANATDEEKRLENGDVKVRVVKNAGHHVYLDGADEFNKMVAEEMKDVEVRQKRLAGKR
ncbi:hypothetical protein LTR17_014929 [Elasticomyces elasticus]|nr:hypothetical protein LTR17_014929 [Elasticomyces elasticus]